MQLCAVHVFDDGMVRRSCNLLNPARECSILTYFWDKETPEANMNTWGFVAPAKTHVPLSAPRATEGHVLMRDSSVEVRHVVCHSCAIMQLFLSDTSGPTNRVSSVPPETEARAPCPVGPSLYLVGGKEPTTALHACAFVYDECLPFKMQNGLLLRASGSASRAVHVD